MKNLMKTPKKIERIKSKSHLISFAFLMLLLPLAGKAQNKTPDHWKCENRIGGSNTFGLWPAACDARVFGEDRYVMDTYVPVVFDQLKSTKEEQLRYMNELSGVIKETAALYIKKRKPNVSPEEVDGFVRASYTMAHQESYWTHYRRYIDSRLKMIRGDSGHGHGLMQIDDRWHFVEIKKGVGWNLIDNLIYSYELYYSYWEKAVGSRCVPRASDYRARARSAYSAYNGGASKICRWTNSSDKWAANDRGFVSKYDKRGWSPYVSDPDKVTLVNVDCLFDGQEACPLRLPSGIDQVLEEGKVYQTQANEVCIYREGALKCLPQMRDVACLQSWGGVSDPSIQQLNLNAERREKKELLDRHNVCLNDGKIGLYKFGSTIKLLKDIYMRATPAGTPMTVIPTDSVVQIFDFEVRDQNQLKRYYQVLWEGKWGFIYSGDKIDFNQWSITNNPAPSEGKWGFIYNSDKIDFDQLFLNNSYVLKNPIFAQIGQKVKIVSIGGINMREVAGGQLMLTIPSGAIVPVLDFEGHNESNDLYYKVKYQDQIGYIYSGRSLPEKTFTNWTAVSGK